MSNPLLENGYQRTLVTAKLMLDKQKKQSFRLTPKAVASDVPSEFDMPDLLFVKFVLASEHENDNGDYFSRSEMLKAYATPRHKPFDVDHHIEEAGSYISEPLYNESKNTIIGHIVDSALAKKDGTILTKEDLKEIDKTDDPCRSDDDSLDLVASAVLYQFCFPKTTADIKEMAEDGEMFVSMETWFKGFDFMVGGDIIEHTDATEHYVDDWNHRKVVGGRRVSRVLKSILFGGVAATEKPANKGSVFLTASLKAKMAQLEKRHSELHILHSVAPSEELIKEHESVTRAIASLQKEQQGQDA
jgi:hypothetical protein